MLRSIQFPMHTASENKYRRQHAMVSAQKTKKQRADVRLFLRQLPAPKLHVNGAPNTFTVRLIRIAVGELDFVNLCGALKGVQDEVAAWIGLDDRDPRIDWDFLQHPCKGSGKRAAPNYCGVRIEVRDGEVAEDRVVVLGDSPVFLAAPARSHGRGRPVKSAVELVEAAKPKAKRGSRQIVAPKEGAPTMIYVKSAFVAPWEQVDGELVLTEIPAFENVEPPPHRATVRAPDQTQIKLNNVGTFDVDGLGVTWLFAPAGHAFDPTAWGLKRIEP